MGELAGMIKGIIEERQKVWHKAKEFNDTAAEKGRLDSKGEFRAEHAATWQKLNRELTLLDDRITELAQLDEQNEYYGAQRAAFAGALNPVQDPTEGDSEANRYLRAWFDGDPRIPRRWSVDFSRFDRTHDEYGGWQVRDRGHSQFETRDLLEVTGAAGGTTVPSSFDAKLYEFLILSSAIRQTNVTIRTTADGQILQVPKVASWGTASIVGEGSALPEADESFGATMLHGWKYGQLIQVSRELTEDTGIDLLGFVAKNAGQAIGYATGHDYVLGTGTNQPMGVLTACGTGVTGGTGVAGVPTSDNIVDLYYSVAAPYRANGFFLSSDATMNGIRKLKDSTGNYLWAPGQWYGGGGIVGSSPDTLMGKPVVTDKFVNATGTGVKSLVFGDFSGYYIRDVKGMVFERSDDYAFGSDLISFRCLLRTDGNLVDLTGCVAAFRGGTA
jgi:HK97 family phage major capsid protein